MSEKCGCEIRIEQLPHGTIKSWLIKCSLCAAAPLMVEALERIVYIRMGDASGQIAQAALRKVKGSQ